VLVTGLLLGGLVLLAGVALVVARPGRSDETGPPVPVTQVESVTPAPVPAPRGEVQAAVVLREWDQRRATVWAEGGEGELTALYVPGAAAGRRDVAMLASWRARGLRVEGLRTQVLDLQLLARGPGRLEVQVVDRVVAGTAVGPGVRRPLPQDAPSTRRVVLRDGPAGWQVARVSAGPRPAPP